MNDPGSFANAAASDLPPDDSPRGIDAQPEKAPVKTEEPLKSQETKVSEPSKSEETKEPVKKEETAKLSNPNLRSEEKKDETHDDEPPVGMTDKAKLSWKKIRENEKAAIRERDALRTERDSIKEQLAQTGNTAVEREALKKELEEAKKQLVDIDGELKVSRVESTRKFKTEVTARVDRVNKSITDLATRYEIPPKPLLDALTETDPGKRSDAISEYIVDMKALDQQKILRAVEQYDEAQEVASQLRKDAAKTLEEITREAKDADEKRITQTTADYRHSVGQQWKAIQESIPELRKVEGQEEWNNYVDSLQREIEAVDVNDLPVSEVARGFVNMKAMPEVLSVLKHYKGETERLKIELAAEKKHTSELKSTVPGAGGGNGNSGKTSERGGFGLFADVVTTAE